MICKICGIPTGNKEYCQEHWRPSFKTLRKFIKKLVAEQEKLQNWRKAVLKRDNYKCVWCKSTKRLNVHHCFRLKSACPERKYDVNNGVTLCRDCHKKTHKTFAIDGWKLKTG